MTRPAIRRLGALSLLVVGGVHLQQYIGDDYRAIPTIGTLFLLNATASAAVALGLLAPLERMLTQRRVGAVIGLLAAAGAAIAIGSLVALFISESGTLFGFSESGYRTAIVVAIAAESVTSMLLAPVAMVSMRQALSQRGGGRPAGAQRLGVSSNSKALSP